MHRFIKLNIYQEFSKPELYKSILISFMEKKLFRAKIKIYFENQGTKDFRNSKKFWQFYKSSVKLRSDKSENEGPNLITYDGQSVSDPVEIVSIFNNFFTSIESVSLSSKDESHSFIDKHFNDLKKKNILKTNINGFSFKTVDESEVEKLFSNLSSSSSPGISDIHPKILKLIPHILIPIYTKLFNFCITTNTFPEEWKSAVVTPLYKNKGSRTDLNNYRGISILSPVSKIFEKLISHQITDYFENSNIFNDGQHGFRKGHSCETALHELLSDLNESRDKKLISLLLFIDFRKAFDTVDSELLLKKLFHYGFDNGALSLITNYFKNRNQVTKIGDNRSGVNNIKLGIPQGSILGPLFFLIFINDLPLYLNELKSKLFADDTTLYHESHDINHLLSDFSIKVRPMFDWCTKNRIDINWSKTYCMFVTDRRVSIPTHIELDMMENGVSIEVVDSFKLLGVIIDNKLNFNNHIAKLCLTINSKLFSINRLFYLCTSVKIQFFKTFILPYFDYCSSLFIYFNKNSLQKLCNKYYLCLFKLFKVEFSDLASLNEVNDYLHKRFGIYSFQHRLFSRISILSFKLLNFLDSPRILQKTMISNFISNIIEQPYSADNIKVLRNGKTIINSVSENISKHKQRTFKYFSAQLMSAIGSKNFDLQLPNFKYFVSLNINSIFNFFNDKICKYNLLFKKFDWVDSAPPDKSNT